MLIVVAVLAGVALLIGIGVALAAVACKLRRARRPGQYRSAATSNVAGNFVPDPSQRGGTYHPPAESASARHSVGYVVGAGLGVSVYNPVGAAVMDEEMRGTFGAGSAAKFHDKL